MHAAWQCDGFVSLQLLLIGSCHHLYDREALVVAEADDDKRVAPIETDGDEDDTEADKARSDSAIKTSKDDTEDTEAPPSRGY